MNQQLILSSTSGHNINSIYVNISVSSHPSHPIFFNRIISRPNSMGSSPSMSSMSSMSSSVSSSSSSQLSSMANLTQKKSCNEFPKWLANCAMFDPIRYKTEMCKNYLELGSCKFSNKCFYAHSTNELKVATYKPKNYKTQLCKPFHLEGFCDFGSRCAFIHSKPDIYQILLGFHSLLCSALPMLSSTADTITNNITDAITDSIIGVTTKRMNPFIELFEFDLIPTKGKRLKLFESIASKEM